jgi:hypothetical protein
MMGRVRGWAKVLLWAGILLACAGVGAFVASRSNPFPPGVPDPGVVPSESPSPTPTEPPEAWSLAMSSRTTHDYRVGGSCTSDWRVRARIRVTDEGDARGRGTARLLPGASCDFPSAQVQARSVVLLVSGKRAGGRLSLRFRADDVRPAGSNDLGAFLETLDALRIRIRERAGARARTSDRVSSDNGDVFESSTTATLRRPS